MNVRAWLLAAVACGGIVGPSTPARAAGPASAPSPQAIRGPLALAPFARPLVTQKMGPFVRLPDGGILAVDETSATISRDEGKTWEPPVPLFAPGVDALLSEERAVVVTRSGTVVVAFRNLKMRSKHNWYSKTHDWVPETRLDVWAVRSTDGGKTWADAQGVQVGGYAGVRAIVQAANGNLVLTTQDIVRGPSVRHVTTAYHSADDGKTWARSQYIDDDGKRHAVIDIGGHGHHDGAIESTVELLKDGRLWMLLRTGHDWFWEAYSADHGLTWKNFAKTPIDASSSPGMLKRLASGRLLLLWNRLYPQGKQTYERRGPDWHKVPASYHREELSAALSDDEGKTWSAPVVIARQPGAWLSYAYVFEPRPGELWVTTMQGNVRVALRESDLAAKP